MRKSLLNLLLLLLIISPLKVYAKSTTKAIEEIDINKKISLTINYDYEDYNFDNTKVKIYFIASLTSDFQYELSEYFLEYPVQINGIKTINEWDILKDTLNSYIESDNIKETYSLTIKDKRVEISNLNVGLYFIKTEKIDTEDYSLIFNDFLLSVPIIDNDIWNYEVTTNVKTEMYTPKYEKINYEVIKKWIDNGINRPKSVNIEIYKNGNLFEVKSLSSTNNWTYNWECLDDGSKWTVVERDIKEGYYVSILEENNKFIITNTNIEEVENPQTSDNINLYFYLLILSLISFSLIIISIFIKYKKIK